MSAQCLRVSTRCPVLIEASITLETLKHAAISGRTPLVMDVLDSSGHAVILGLSGQYHV